MRRAAAAAGRGTIHSTAAGTIIMGNLVRRALTAAALGLALATPTWAKAPNIVFILTDDLDTASAAYMT
jgi:hypothetical protein